MIKLYPSEETQKLLKKYKPLDKSEQELYANQYAKNKSEKAAMALFNGISYLFASAINRNNAKFVATLPQATYDDIFNQMTLDFFKNLYKFDPKKSKLTTWASYVIMPLVMTPLKVMGDKFGRKHGLVNIDMKMGTNGGTIATMLPDTSIDVEDDYETGNKHAKLMKAIKRLDKEDQEIILNLFGFVPPKKEWQSKTGKINAASIGRGFGVDGGKMRGRVADILKKLEGYLKQSKFDRHFSLNRLIEQYSKDNKR